MAIFGEEFDSIDSFGMPCIFVNAPLWNIAFVVAVCLRVQFAGLLDPRTALVVPFTLSVEDRFAFADIQARTKVPRGCLRCRLFPAVGCRCIFCLLCFGIQVIKEPLPVLKEIERTSKLDNKKDGSNIVQQRKRNSARQKGKVLAI